MQVYVESVAPTFTAVQWFKEGDYPGVRVEEGSKIGTIQTKAGIKVVRPGEFIVRRRSGDFSIYQEKEFKNKFKPALTQ
jgi:hypothetical protein